MFIVNIGGIEYEVSIVFFERIIINEEKLIGDTYFIGASSEESTENFFFTINKDQYYIVKRDLKIGKILN